MRNPRISQAKASCSDGSGRAPAPPGTRWPEGLAPAWSLKSLWGHLQTCHLSHQPSSSWHRRHADFSVCATRRQHPARSACGSGCPQPGWHVHPGRARPLCRVALGRRGPASAWQMAAPFRQPSSRGPAPCTRCAPQETSLGNLDPAVSDPVCFPSRKPSAFGSPPCWPRGAH